MDLYIRKIEKEDLTKLIPLCSDHAKYEGSIFKLNGQEERLKTAFFDELPSLFGWVLYKNQDLFGYMTATVDFSTWDAHHYVYMDCLYLVPEFRAKGYGKKFIEILKVFSIDRECKHIQWQTPPENRTGMAFYSRINAKPKNKVRYFLDCERL